MADPANPPAANPAPNTPPVTTPPADPAATPPASPPAADPPPADPPSGDKIEFKDSKALGERMDRNYRSKLKGIGVEDPDKLKDDLKELEDLRKAREEQRLSDLSEQERLKEEQRVEKERADNAEKALKEMRADNQVRDLCSELNISNISYARFKLAEAAKSHTGEEAFDPKKALEDALASDAVALGAKKADPVSVPADTNPGSGAKPTPAPGTGGPIDAAKMTDEEFRQFCADRGY